MNTTSDDSELSAWYDRVDDVLDNNEQQHSSETGARVDAGDDICWRCIKHPPVEGGELCEQCRAFLLGDNEHDPAAEELLDLTEDDEHNTGATYPPVVIIECWMQFSDTRAAGLPVNINRPVLLVTEVEHEGREWLVNVDPLSWPVDSEVVIGPLAQIELRIFDHPTDGFLILRTRVDRYPTGVAQAGSTFNFPPDRLYLSKNSLVIASEMMEWARHVDECHGGLFTPEQAVSAPAAEIWKGRLVAYHAENDPLNDPGDVWHTLLEGAPIGAVMTDADMRAVMCSCPTKLDGWYRFDNHDSVCVRVSDPTVAALFGGPADGKILPLPFTPDEVVNQLTIPLLPDLSIDTSDDVDVDAAEHRAIYDLVPYRTRDGAQLFRGRRIEQPDTEPVEPASTSELLTRMQELVLALPGDHSTAAALIDGFQRAGEVTIHGRRFTIDDDDQVQVETVDEAVHAALADAEAVLADVARSITQTVLTET